MSGTGADTASGVAEASPDAEQLRALGRASAAGVMGTFVEWFDYACYGYLAVIFAVVFFPAADARGGLMAAYGVFALSFVVRPIGGMIWGHFGDRIGRKAALAASIFIMSVSTALIAVLPTYAMVGFWAPALLLATRLLQGFAASGEYAGAASFLSEYAPRKKRGFYTSLVPAGEAAGLLASSALVALLHTLLTAEQLQGWGWRLPFLLALPLGIVGVFIRQRLDETPAFQGLERAHGVPKAPILELAAKHRSELLIGFLGTMLNAVGFYVVLSYMPTYLTAELGVSPRAAFLGSSISLSVYLVAIFVMGALSDRLGRRNVLIACSVLFAALALPLFMIATRSASDGLGGPAMLPIFAAWSVLAALLAMNGGTLPTFLCELFPTRVRFSGFAISFNAANALFGGTAPLISTWMIGATGNKLAPAWYLTAAAVITLLAVHKSRVARQPDLSGRQPEQTTVGQPDT